MSNQSPLIREVQPLRQATLAVVGMPVLMLLFLVPSWCGFFELEDYFPWTIAAAITLLFGVANSVLYLGSSNHNKYVGASISCYIGVMVIGGFLAWMFSGLNVYEAKSFKSIYVVFTIGYLVILSIAMAVNKVAEVTQRYDREKGKRGGES